MSKPMTPDLNSSLSSLAMLSLQLSEGKDYLDYLHGFVVGALGHVKSEAFDATTVQELVERQYGLRIPAATFAIYLKQRLTKAKVVSLTATGVQYRIVKLPPTTVEQDREVARARIAEVTDELAGFAFAEYEKKWDDRDSSAALAEFVRQYSIDFLRFSEAKSPLPAQDPTEKVTDYIVASFITHCAKNQPGLFESIKVLVQSHILANALMCPDLQVTNRGFKGVHFFVDTRFMLKALDLESEFDTNSARSLLAAIRKLNGVLCIFPETKAEIEAVLRANIRGIQSGAGRGPIFRELLKRHKAVTDIIFAESNLDASLASLSISMFPSPAYDENNYQFQIDEVGLRSEIEEEIEYLTDKAAVHDIRVVRNIFALRKGRSVSSIENSGYVFLTTNSALSRAAFHYERKNSSGWIFSAVVTDYHLSHLAWLKSPMQAADLPRAEILASCYGAMCPNESMWSRYLVELDRLKADNKVSASDHEVLRFSVHAPDELMDVTRGEVEGITEANLHRILEKLEKGYAADKQQQIEKIKQEHDAIKNELAQTQSVINEQAANLADATAREKSLRQERAQQDQKLEELRRLEDTARTRAAMRRNRIEALSNKIATWAYVTAWVVFTVFGILSILTSWSAWLAVPFAIVGVLNIAAGFSGGAIRQFVRHRVEHRLSKLIE